MDIKEKFIGAWDLKKCVIIDKNNKEQKDPFFGNDSSGLITYSHNNMVSAQIITKQFKDYFSKKEIKDLSKLTEEEIHKGYYGFMTYYGNYKIYEDKKIITHMNLNSSWPNIFQKDLHREFTFRGNDVLVLRTIPPEEIRELTWLKIK